LNVPVEWLRTFEPPASTVGMHRFVWDLHGPPRKSGEPPISAILHDTPINQGTWMPPGEYTVRLTAGGQSYVQRLVVRADPR